MVVLFFYSSVDPSTSLQQSPTTADQVGLSGALQSVRHVAVSNTVGFGQNDVAVDMPISSVSVLVFRMCHVFVMLHIIKRFTLFLMRLTYPVE